MTEVAVTAQFMRDANAEQLAAELAKGRDPWPSSFVQTDPDDLLGSWVYLVDRDDVTVDELAAGIKAHVPTWGPGETPPVRLWLDAALKKG